MSQLWTQSLATCLNSPLRTEDMTMTVLFFRTGGGKLCLSVMMLVSAVLMNVSTTRAQTLTTLHSFSNGLDGSHPQAGLIADRAGNLYGTTTTAGLPNLCPPFGCGTVFEMSYRNSAWRFAPLYSFQGESDGSNPSSRLVIGPDGALYGTTFTGGQGNCHGQNPHCGIVFRLQPPAGPCHAAQCPWTEKILYAFPGGTAGGEPMGDITFDPAGNIYGTTAAGGDTAGNCATSGCGVVYELSPSNGIWTETVLYTFMGGTDGSQPNGGVIRDAAGSLYGTTSEGGTGCPSGGCGTVFELSPSQDSWTETVLHKFKGHGFDDGAFPNAGLTMDSRGNLFGATTTYGSAQGGTVFELTPDGGSWTFSTIYELGGSFGGGPAGALAVDGSGNLYGAARYDGPYNDGNIFKLTFTNGSWVYTNLYNFTGQEDGAWLYDGLVLGAQGAIYGIAFHGGTYNYGDVFEISQ